MTTPPTGPGFCPACGAPLSAGARFCHRCGAPPAGAVPSRGPGPAWIVAGLAVVAAVIAIAVLLSQPRPASPDTPPPGMTGGFTGRAPDISSMTPRQMFDRLYERSLAASEQGDTATVLRMTDHALSAYAQLDEVDADARYHAGVLLAGIGRYAPALALADTILAEAPDHLLGHLLRGTVAGFRGDAAALTSARSAFLAAWPREAAGGRPEYLDHQSVLDQFRQAAEAAR
jgi:hypothetical protein